MRTFPSSVGWPRYLRPVGAEDEARRTINAFIRRAERIARTDAARREDLASVGSTMKILVRMGHRQQRIERTHLPEPELIQAATVIRPVVLKREQVHFGRVVNGIRLLTLDAPSAVTELVVKVKKSWPSMLTAERWIIMVSKIGEAEQTRLTDVEVAELWFNAYVWHDDQAKQWALRHLSEEECLISASVWVSDRILLVRALQQFIGDLQEADYLPR